MHQGASFGKIHFVEANVAKATLLKKSAQRCHPEGDPMSSKAACPRFIQIVPPATSSQRAPPVFVACSIPWSSIRCYY